MNELHFGLAPIPRSLDPPAQPEESRFKSKKIELRNLQNLRPKSAFGKRKLNRRTQLFFSRPVSMQRIAHEHRHRQGSDTAGHGGDE